MLSMVRPALIILCRLPPISRAHPGRRRSQPILPPCPLRIPIRTRSSHKGFIASWLGRDPGRFPRELFQRPGRKGTRAVLDSAHSDALHDKTPKRRQRCPGGHPPGLPERHALSPITEGLTWRSAQFNFQRRRNRDPLGNKGWHGRWRVNVGRGKAAEGRRTPRRWRASIAKDEGRGTK